MKNTTDFIFTDTSPSGASPSDTLRTLSPDHKLKPVTEALVVEQIKSDFRNMLYVVWKHLGLPSPDPIQYDIAEFLQHGPTRCVIEAFRGVGKSWITAAFVLWLLLRDHEYKIMVVSAGEDRSIAFATFVKQLIHDMPLLHHLRARPKQRDSVEAFDVGPCGPHQSPSVKSVGITGQITGSRADIIIADDIETPKNSQTAKQRLRIAELVREFDAVLTTRADARVIYLGTPQCESSLYNLLPERRYTIRVWPAEVPANDKVRNYKGRLSPFIQRLIDSNTKPGEPTEPRRFNSQQLMDRRASWGRSGYALQFMLDTTLSDADRYPLRMADLMIADVADMIPVDMVWGGGVEQVIDDLPCVGIDGDRLHRPAFVSKDFTKFTGTVMFLDPSGRGSDETGGAIVSAHGARLFLRSSFGYRDGYSTDTLQAICTKAKRYGVNLIIVEPNYGGGMFNELLKAALVKHGYPCRVEEAEWSRGQKEARILDVLEPVVQSHRLVVCRSVIQDDAKVEPIEYQLFHQFTRLTRERGALGHDDRVEALAGAVFYYLNAVGQDEKQATERHRQELLDAELEKFMEAARGKSDTREGWLGSFHL